MRAGSGKSLCYQLPALLLGGATLVVSPLIALMRGQLAGHTLPCLVLLMRMLPNACRVWQVIVLSAASAAARGHHIGCVPPDSPDEGSAGPPAPSTACCHAVGRPEQAGSCASPGRPQGDCSPVAVQVLADLKVTARLLLCMIAAV